ncbi:MAG: RDD family protein [Lachnospiraceae bacterium]
MDQTEATRLPGFYPWRRYFARTLDQMIYGCLWQAVPCLIFGIKVVIPNVNLQILGWFLGLVLTLVLEPLFLSWFAATPGKAIFGIRVTRADGSKLSYQESFRRTWTVLQKGAGFDIPIYSLFRFYVSYQACVNRQDQIWDEDISYTLKDTRWYRAAGFVAANMLLIFVVSASAMALTLPPNRGKLTIAQFAENYNYLAEFYERKNGFVLNAEGQWEEEQSDDDVVIRLNDSNFTHVDFQFEVEDGKITGISFEQELQNGPNVIYRADRQIMLTILAYCGADKSVGIFDAFPAQVMAAVERGMLDGTGTIALSTEQTEVFCKLEHPGYSYMDNMGLVITDEEAEDLPHSYKVEFQAKKK